MRHGRRERVLRPGARPRATRRRGALGSSPVPPFLARQREVLRSSPELQAPLHFLSGLGARDVPRGHRADHRRLRPDPLGQVGGGAADRRFPARGRNRAPARSAGRPPFAEAAARRCRRRASDRLRPAHVHGHAGPDRRARARRRRRHRLRPAGRVRGAPEPRLRRRSAARERRCCDRRPVDDHRRDVRRRSDRRRFGTGSRLLVNAASFLRLGRVCCSRSRARSSSRAEAESHGHWRTWPTASARSPFQALTP